MGESGQKWAEQQDQWTANWRFCFLFPSSRASRSCRAPREILRSPRLAHKAPVLQASAKSLKTLQNGLKNRETTKNTKGKSRVKSHVRVRLIYILIISSHLALGPPVLKITFIPLCVHELMINLYFFSYYYDAS